MRRITPSLIRPTNPPYANFPCKTSPPILTPSTTHTAGAGPPFRMQSSLRRLLPQSQLKKLNVQPQAVHTSRVVPRFWSCGRTPRLPTKSWELPAIRWSCIAMLLQ